MKYTFKNILQVIVFYIFKISYIFSNFFQLLSFLNNKEVIR